MSGPEHYREAERLLQAVSDMTADTSEEAALLNCTFMEAQVHATLALAAAQAEMTGRRVDRGSEWERTLS